MPLKRSTIFLSNRAVPKIGNLHLLQESGSLPRFQLYSDLRGIAMAFPDSSKARNLWAMFDPARRSAYDPKC
jgi:hypothetical protein